MKKLNHMDANLKLSWIRAGVTGGFLTFLAYPAMVLFDLPVQFTLVLALSFGIFFMITSIGLYHFISIKVKAAALQAAVLFNIIACAVAIMMFTIQLSLFSEKAYSGQDVSKELVNHIFGLVNLIQLSLDVVWDVFISLGTILLAFCMLKHPRLGRVIGSIGMLLGAALLFNNIYFFPLPPAEAGSIDFGPFVAMWYVAVSVMMLRSLSWTGNELKIS